MLKRKCVWIGILVIIATVIIGPNSYAANDTTDFSIKVNPSLNLSVSSSAVGFRLTPTKEGNFGSASFDVYASTNNPTGYKLIMSTDKINLESDTINPTTGAKPTIPTLAQDGISPAVFEASTDPNILNHYGVAIKNGDYNAMKSTQEIEKTTVNNVTEDTIAVSLATKLNLLIVPGVYSTTLNFQIVANIYTKGGSINEDGNYPAKSLLRAFEIAYTEAGKQMYIEDANTDIGWRPMVGADFDTVGGKEVRFAMQDISMTFEENGVTQNVCEWATASTADNSYINEAPVMDLRDGKTYWIAKLADGKCWMTQNLDLDLVHMANDEDALYTHANTDLGWGTDTTTTKWNPERSTIPVSSISASGAINGWINDSDDPYSVDAGNWYWTDTWYESTTNNYLSGNAGDKFSQIAYTRNGSHGHVGNYYNWTAAIASNDSSSYRTDTYSNPANNPQNSICPAGWKLPIMTNYSYGQIGNNDFFNLVNLYQGAMNTDLGITASPLHFIRGGAVLTNLNNPGSDGYYWSSTAGTVAYSGNAYFLHFSSGYIDLSYSDRSLGNSIRCIAR